MSRITEARARGVHSQEEDVPMVQVLGLLVDADESAGEFPTGLVERASDAIGPINYRLPPRLIARPQLTPAWELPEVRHGRISAARSSLRACRSFCRSPIGGS